MFCRNCEADIGPEDNVCGKCGMLPLAGVRFCHRCGGPTSHGAVVCPACDSTLPRPVSSYSGDGGTDKKVVAGLCGIFLGAFGVHKFVLGYTKEGLIMLLVSLLTCGFGFTIMGMVGFIEGIIYLTRTDAGFQSKYIDRQTPWF